jgi:hypothetical protein
MNKLIIGMADKTPALHTKQGFLLIDDGPIADAFLTRFKRAKEFSPSIHSFNPLPTTYRKAREFASVVFGDEGKETLTVRNGKRALTRLLLKADRLDRLAPGKSDADKEAIAAVDDLLISPVLHDVLCKPTNFSFREGRSSIVARINRAELGDYDARILGSLLMSKFKGQIIVPDFGFYARDFHVSLIRENRLIAGVFTLSELNEKLRQMCLMMEKEAAQCTYEDAEVVARYEGLIPTTNGYNARLEQLMA